MEDAIIRYYERWELDRFFDRQLLQGARLRRYDRGERICSLEEPVRALHFFVAGRVKVYTATENGRQLLLCFYEPLQLFGDLELVEEEPLATATVEALVPTTCLELPRELVHEHLMGSSAFLGQLSRSLSRKLGRVIRNSALNQLNPLESRVASYILATAALEGDALMFTGNLSLIAEQLGTSFRHLHRTLQRLTAEGILDKQGLSYRVLNPEELNARAAGAYIIR